jgi:hypothetical protein
MFLESLQNFVGEIESVVLGVALLEGFDNTQALLVVIEASVILHEAVEGLLPGMAERGMSQVMGKGDRLGQILVESKRSGDGPADRGDFDGVRQTGAVVVPFAVEKDLGLAI